MISAKQKEDSRRIELAKGHFWSGLVSALQAAGATAEYPGGLRPVALSDTETVMLPNNLVLGGVEVPLHIKEDRKPSTSFRTGLWTGNLSVVYSGLLRSKVWKTRKVGWDFPSIAAFLIEATKEETEAARARERAWAAEQKLQDSPEFLALQERAAVLGAAIATRKGRVILTLDLDLPDAVAVIGVLGKRQG